jgi:hypothetical protein
MVKQFYECIQINSIKTGTKDWVSVNLEGRKVHFQKRMILCNLQEAYLSLNVQNPEKLLGFSKFVELWPRDCVFAGVSGTHAVFVCTSHQIQLLDLEKWTFQTNTLLLNLYC